MEKTTRSVLEMKRVYMDNKMKLFSLIWGQSSKSTQSKIETHMNYAWCKTEYDSLGLLKIIRELYLRAMIVSKNIKQKIRPRGHATHYTKHLR
jgi:hypothetical protein